MVDFYNHPYSHELKPIYLDLSAKLESKGINPEYSWLGERKNQIQFQVKL